MRLLNHWNSTTYGVLQGSYCLAYLIAEVVHQYQRWWLDWKTCDWHALQIFFRLECKSLVHSNTFSTECNFKKSMQLKKDVNNIYQLDIYTSCHTIHNTTLDTANAIKNSSIMAFKYYYLLGKWQRIRSYRTTSVLESFNKITHNWHSWIMDQ